MKKYLSYIFSLILLASAAYIFFHKGDPSGQDSMQDALVTGAADILFPVRTEMAQQQNLILWIPCSGLARPAKEADIIAQTSGYLDFLNAHNGLFVRQGHLLARFNDASARLDLRDAENNLLSSSIEYNIIKSGPTRLLSTRPAHLGKQIDSLTFIYHAAQQNFAAGSLREDQFQRIRRDYESLLTYRDFDRDDVVANKCGLNQALVGYDRAKLYLDYCELRAPFDGYVAECKLLSTGSYINAGFNCMKLVDLSRINIMTKVTESQIGKIRIGHAAEVRFVAYPEGIKHGRVVEINPYIDPDKRTGEVTVEIPNSAHRIIPGMYANVRIQGDVVANTIVVPRAAVVMRDNRPVVFVAQNNLAKWHYVSLGAENEDSYQITKGIAAGDSIIIDGNYNLAHDAKIKTISSGQ